MWPELKILVCIKGRALNSDVGDRTSPLPPSPKKRLRNPLLSSEVYLDRIRPLIKRKRNHEIASGLTIDKLSFWTFRATFMLSNEGGRLID